jgi:hypothetical protein
VQIEIVYSPNTQDTPPRKSRTDTVHECTTRGTKVIGHHISRGDRTILAEFFEVFLAAYVFQMRVRNGEIGREDRCCDFSAIGAVADEGID